MKVLSVVGARPQFVKALAVSRALRLMNREVLVHTGQHYDFQMSQVFFKELGLPVPDYNLGVGSGSHGEQTGRMLIALDEVMAKEKPDVVLVYGDTNSTLAGALAGAKLGVPVAHVEAGLRSFNRAMPEEINRVLTDHVSDLLFCPTPTAVDNLGREGISAGVYLVGDCMYDALLAGLELAEKAILHKLGLSPSRYFFLTVHRAANTDDPGNLEKIISALERAEQPVIFPVHPRTQKALQKFGLLEKIKNLKLLEPVGYLDSLTLQKNARLVFTDSGGVQKEAFLLGVPCLTLREETEWVETVDLGANLLVGIDPERILAGIKLMLGCHGNWDKTVYGDGRAGEKIAEILAARFPV